MCVATGEGILTKDWLEFVVVLSTNLGIDVSPHDELRVFWDFQKNRGEVLIELFMWSIMVWVVDRCKEDIERFPLYLLAGNVKAVKLKIEANKLACKIARGFCCDWQR